MQRWFATISTWQEKASRRLAKAGYNEAVSRQF